MEPRFRRGGHGRGAHGQARSRQGEVDAAVHVAMGPPTVTCSVAVRCSALPLHSSLFTVTLLRILVHFSLAFLRWTPQT
uniref:Uncharacterized protein n=1 Tax=Arundo donax TaxID=35708 RepID=A0A0A9GFE6_ARUDO